MRKFLLLIVATLLLVGCGDSKISADEQLKCTEAIDGAGLTGRNIQGFHIDEYGYLCCVIAVKDLLGSADGEAMLIYSDACQPPIKGVKIINSTDGKELGRYKKN